MKRSRYRVGLALFSEALPLIVFLYAYFGGMWLPTSSEFTVKVRLLGLSTMLTHDLGYRYSRLAGGGGDPADTGDSTAHNLRVGLLEACL